MKEMTTGEKYLLTIKEAGEYFNIGVKKMRRLAEENLGLQRKQIPHKSHKIRGVSLQYFYDLILFILPLVVAIFTIKSNI